MIDLGPACDEMIRLMAKTPDGALDGPTPCADFTVAGLVAHVDQAARGFTGVAREATGDDGPDLEFGPGWRDRAAGHLRDLAAAWADPAAWRGTGAAAGIELARELWGKIAFTEVVVHGWDLARATGQSFDLPDETLRACLEHVERFVPNAPLPELWGAPVPVADGAPLIDRIVAITGRTP